MKTSTRTELLEHSRAKVELLRRYFSTFLNIISRVNYYDKIHFYDLMCGEGVYNDNSEGSPISILKTIKDHFFSNNRNCPNIDLWFNDNGISDIEPELNKIQRVENYAKNIFQPKNIDIKYSDNDYISIYPEILEKIKNHKKDKHLIFIDPHGYKEIKLKHIKEYLKLGNAEVLLFLPVFDMYRFANKSYDNSFSGGKSLREFLKDVFPNEVKQFSSVFDFIEKVKLAFSNHTSCFVDTFLLQKEKNNYYGLFFFTPNALGFEKMLEAKWKIDDKEGRGFINRIQNQHSLFEELEVSNYSHQLINYLKEDRTNGEIYIFGLNKGHLPKHSIEVLKPLRKEGKLKVLDQTGNEVPKNGFYLKYEYYKNPKKKTVIYSI